MSMAATKPPTTKIAASVIIKLPETGAPTALARVFETNQQQRNYRAAEKHQVTHMEPIKDPQKEQGDQIEAHQGDEQVFQGAAFFEQATNRPQADRQGKIEKEPMRQDSQDAANPEQNRPAPGAVFGIAQGGIIAGQQKENNESLTAGFGRKSDEEVRGARQGHGGKGFQAAAQRADKAGHGHRGGASQQDRQAINKPMVLRPQEKHKQGVQGMIVVGV
jgi:hypothetical protein